MTHLFLYTKGKSFVSGTKSHCRNSKTKSHRNRETRLRVVAVVLDYVNYRLKPIPVRQFSTTDKWPCCCSLRRISYHPDIIICFYSSFLCYRLSLTLITSTTNISIFLQFFSPHFNILGPKVSEVRPPPISSSASNISGTHFLHQKRACCTLSSPASQITTSGRFPFPQLT